MEACGPLLTCSFHKCLLFFNSGNKQSILGGGVCGYTTREPALYTQTDTQIQYGSGVGEVSEHASALISMEPSPTPPLQLTRVGGGQVTDIHWFGSFHLFVLFIDFHYSSSCRSLPCFRRHFHCVSSHFASRRTQAQLHAYLLASANQSTSSTFLFFSPPHFVFFFFLWLIYLWLINLCNNSGSSHFVTQFESMAWMRYNLIFVKKPEKCKNMYV